MTEQALPQNTQTLPAKASENLEKTIKKISAVAMLIFAGWLALIFAINWAASEDLLNLGMMWGIQIASAFVVVPIFLLLPESLDSLEKMRKENDHERASSS